MHVGADTRTEIEKIRIWGNWSQRQKACRNSIRILKDYNSTATPLIKLDEDSLPKKTKGVRIKVGEAEYQSGEAYDSAQKKLPESKRDGWVRHKLKRRTIELSRAFEENPAGSLKEWLSNFMHNFPKVLFISLPLFAGILNLIYYRHRNFYYVDHGIFAVHLYIFSFLVLLGLFGLKRPHTATHLELVAWMEFALIVYVFIIISKRAQVLRTKQGKTWVKYILLL